MFIGIRLECSSLLVLSWMFFSFCALRTVLCVFFVTAPELVELVCVDCQEPEHLKISQYFMVIEADEVLRIIPCKPNSQQSSGSE
jgi:hypothetical protein